MMPIRDENPSRSTPFVTYALILANIAVFAYEVMLAMYGQLEEFIYTYGMIPALVSQGEALHTLLTSMFLHGGVFHLLGNMLYLYIFGDNIEDAMGHRRYLIFYLLTGFAASALQIAINPASTLPNVGASGAIAGVLGAYFVTYPFARVHTIIFLGYFIRWVSLPAVVLLGFWFIFQLFAGTATLEAMKLGYGGVAYFAHVGGFVAGMVLVRFFRKK
jgi:membrane associated rhomboid family serine protease